MGSDNFYADFSAGGKSLTGRQLPQLPAVGDEVVLYCKTYIVEARVWDFARENIGLQRVLLKIRYK